MNYGHQHDGYRNQYGQRDTQRYDPDPSNNLLSEQSSDERLRHDASAALQQYGIVHADAISVRVREGIVTLAGDVSSRHAKRAAEECVRRLPGVEFVSNRLRVGRELESDYPPAILPSSSDRSPSASKFSKRLEPSANTAR